jgi:phosphoglucomutase
MPIDESILRRAKIWMDGDFDAETRKQVKELADSDPVELSDSFYRDLEFGTGGLRGIMGVGTNRMNKYTVGMATQGLANYLKTMFSDFSPIRVAISYDSRNNSSYFARITAEVFAANDFTVYLFEDLRPTPELSFAIRYLGCQSGVMITASHNPKEYNGYKAYWDDGAQMIEPHDENVISEVQKITTIAQVKWEGKSENIQIIGKDIDEAYIADVMKLRLSPQTISKQKSLGVVYTPLHGTGIMLVPEVLKRFGFVNVTVVKEQAVTDGSFPTLRSPNPEDRDALNLAIQKAEEIGADLVMATDPDADRVGIAVRDHEHQMILLNGNQTAAILFYYILTKWKELGKLKGKEYAVSTIVTSGILGDIVKSFGVDYYECLTGFKYIADVIRKNEGKAEFIVGGEESYGYLVGDFVRDKDAVSACAMIAEAAAWMAEKGKTLFDLLLEIYQKYSFYKEGLHSVTKKGKAGAEEIQAMMVGFRSNPPKVINGSRVIMIKDYKDLVEHNTITGQKNTIDLPASNVLQFFTNDGSRISIRPSGTEPKIKFYIGVREALHGISSFTTTNTKLDRKIEGIISSMNLK